MRELAILTVLAAIAAAQEQSNVPFRDDLASLDAWRLTTEADGALSGGGGRLVLERTSDTAGTAAARRALGEPLSARGRWLAVRVPELRGAFFARLVDLETGFTSPALGVIQQAGWSVAPVPDEAPWDQPRRLALELTVYGEPGRAVVDQVALVNRLEAEPQAAWEAAQARLIRPRGPVLLEERFDSLERWHHEGGGEAKLEPEVGLRLEVIGSRQGGAGCMLFSRTTFPDRIALEYELKVLTRNGLVITFIAAEGLGGEDMLTELPPRTGIFRDYVGDDAKLRSYHVSVSRYNDRAEHTGVSNWRRNPGLHLMAQGPDLCQETGRWYRIRIVKDGPRVQLQVNDELAHEFTDPDTLPLPLPTQGKIGFRAIGSDVRALVRGLRVVALEP